MIYLLVDLGNGSMGHFCFESGVEELKAYLEVEKLVK
jgi:hypothetical protein